MKTLLGKFLPNFILPALFFSFFNEAIAQSSIDGINIPDGSTHTLSLSSGQQDLIIGNLTMGNNSVLRIPPDFPYWNVYIQEATIGLSARIDATGINGSDQLGTPDPALGKAKCERKGLVGNPGSASPRGMAGGSGRDIMMRIGIRNVGSLLIDTMGGTGGASGNGGAGGKGARGSCNRRCNGERGGIGGTARQSDGGAGGDVQVDFWFVGVGSGSTNPIPGISFRTEGGNPGLLGSPGAGGPGGSRKGCRITRNRSGGSQGPSGRIEQGRAGEKGEVVFRSVSPVAASVVFDDLKAESLND